MSLTTKSIATAAVLLLAAPAAFANTIPTVTAQDATNLNAPPSGFGNLANFGSIAGNPDANGMIYSGNLAFTGQGGGTINFENGSSPYAGVYAAGTQNNNVLDPTYNTGLSHANFLGAEVGNDIVINFNTKQTTFNLLWGSVDTYNSIIFKFSGGGSSYTLTGSQVAALAGGFNPNGTTSAFVEISKLSSFKTLTIEDTTRPAFELVTEDLGNITTVPEPASLAMLMSGLVVFGLYVSRRPNRSV